MTNKDILYFIKKDIPSIEYERYVKQLNYKKNSSSDSLAIFEVPNQFILKWIENRYLSNIKNAFNYLNSSKPKIQIKVKVKKTIIEKNLINVSEQLKYKENTILNPSYSFDNFVVGTSNQMAYNAITAVSKKQGILYNPLFIYGGTGLGKTHLLQASGNFAIENNKNVIYVTIEQFMNDFTFSIKNKSMEHFRSKYRKCDLL